MTRCREAAVELSEQIALVMKLRSLALGHSEVFRYNGGDFPASRATPRRGWQPPTASPPVGGGWHVLLEISDQTKGDLDTLIADFRCDTASTARWS